MKGLIWTGSGLILLALLGFLSLTQGLADISLSTVIESLYAPAQSLEQQLIQSVRMPRTVMALLAGAALALAGTIMQTVTRNPLASETTLGVNAGAHLAVILGMLYAPMLFREFPLIFAATGGLAAFLLVFWLGGGLRSTPVRFVLSGMIVTLTLSSFSSGLFIFHQEAAKGLFLWGAGSLIQNNWSGALFSGPWVLGTLLLALLLSRQLDLLTLDEATNRSLGQRTATYKVISMGLAVLAVSVIVSVVGPIGFVGLVAPHLVKLSGIRRHVILLPLAALWGAAMLIGADTIARSFVDLYGELPTGAITALIGSPWLIWLALRSFRTGGNGSAESMGYGTRLWRAPAAWLLVILVAAFVGLAFLSLSMGSLSFTLADIIAVLRGQGEPFPSKILLGIRMPRMLVAALAGAALAAAGALMQSALRNPLADPHVLGITGGAGVGAMLLLIVMPQLSIQWMPLAAAAGAMTVGLIVLSTGWRSGLSPMKMTLIGIAMSAIMAAITSLLVIQAKMGVAPALAWLAGSTYAQTWSSVNMLVIGLLLLLPIAWYMGRRVELLTFSEHSAAGLGLPVRGTRLFVVVLAILLTALAVSAVGTIGFIGLLAPHAARMLAGTGHRLTLVIASLFGAMLLMTADLIGRSVMAPLEIPSGIVVSLIGAPYLGWLLFKTRVR